MPDRLVERIAACVAFAWLLAASPVRCFAEELFYRYVNGQGVTVIDDHVPPKYARNGYAVLNKNGRVVEVVPRVLTAEELKNGNSEEVHRRLRAEEATRQRRYDEKLLERYSTIADIEAARTRKVNEVGVRINSLKGSIASLSAQVDQRQREAADLERAGEKVPPQLPRDIAALRAEIAKAERDILIYESERKTTEARFQYDIDRFRVLRPPQPPPPQPDPADILMPPDAAAGTSR